MYLCVINPSKTARNIGALFDSSLSMEEHIKASCKSAFFHLSNIARIRKHLLAQAAETLIRSLVTSKVDFCNSLRYGVPNQLIQKLQSVQNSAARLLTYTNKREHIKPVIKQFHWLPVEFRVPYKILLRSFECLNDTALAYLNDLIHLSTPNCSLRWNSKNYLAHEQYQLKSYGPVRAFTIAAPILCNALSDRLRDHSNFLYLLIRNKLKHIYLK